MKKTVGELAWYMGSIFITNLAVIFFYYQNIIGVIDEQTSQLNSRLVFLFFLTINMVFYLSWIFRRIKRKLMQLIERMMYWIRKKQCPSNILNNPNFKYAMYKTNGQTETEENLLIFFAWIFSWFTSLLSLIILISLINNIDLIEEKEPYEIFSLLSGFWFILMLGNFVFAYFREKPERQWWFLLIPFIAVIFIFSLAKEAFIPKMVMRGFHFGNFTAERLILDKEGCQILRSMALKPEPVEDEKTQDLKECYLENIKILSRIGAAFVLEKEIDCKKFNLSIPKDHVLSWRIIKEEAKGESGKDIDSDSVQAKTNIEKTTDTCSKDN